MASEASGVAGSMTGAAGSLIQGQAQANALDRAAAIQRQNAALDLQTGEANAAISAVRSDKKIGGITSAYGAAGIDTNSGSVLQVLAASASNAELDRQNIMHGAKVRAINYENQATMDEIGAKSALQGSYLNAFSSLAMGGSKAFGNSSGVSPGNYTPSGYGEGGGAESYGEGGGYGAAGEGAAEGGTEYAASSGAADLAFV